MTVEVIVTPATPEDARRIVRQLMEVGEDKASTRTRRVSTKEDRPRERTA